MLVYGDVRGNISNSSGVHGFGADQKLTTDEADRNVTDQIEKVKDPDWQIYTTFPLVTYKKPLKKAHLLRGFLHETCWFPIVNCEFRG